MTCPNCKQPMAGGLFMCQRCEGRTGAELSLIAALDECTGFAGLPAPINFQWKGGNLLVTYKEMDWLGSRSLFTSLSYHKVATSARHPKEAIYTVKFYNLAGLKAVLDESKAPF